MEYLYEIDFIIKWNNACNIVLFKKMYRKILLAKYAKENTQLLWHEYLVKYCCLYTTLKTVTKDLKQNLFFFLGFKLYSTTKTHRTPIYDTE